MTTSYTPQGADFALNALTAGDQYEPRITELADGRLVAVWYSSDTTQDGSDNAIMARLIAADGTPLGTEFVVNAAGAGKQIDPVVTALDDGGFMVAWETRDASGDGSGYAIRARAFTATGAPAGGEFLVNTEAGMNQAAPAIATLADGNVVVAWGTDNGADVKAQVFTAAGVKVGGEFMLNTPANGGNTVQLAALASGGFVATWTLGSGALADVYGQVFDSGGAKVGSEFRANTFTTGSQNGVRAAGLADGSFVVVWYTADATQDGSSSAIKAQRFDADGTALGSEFLVNAVAAGTQTNPRVVALEDGNFVVSWEDGRISARVFDAGGNPVGEQMTLFDDANYQSDTDIVALSGGGFAVAWTEMTFTSGTAIDVRARIYQAESSNAAPEFAAATLALEVEEGQALAASVSAVDPEGDAVAYTIAGGADRDRFAIDPATGALFLLATPDFEAPGDADGDNVYTVIVRASDGGGADLQTVAVTVVNVNEGLAFTSPVAVAGYENATAVTTVVARDIDGDAVFYSIVGGADAPLFAIDAATGALSFVAPRDFEAPGDAGGDNRYDVVVSASDGSFSATQAVMVELRNVNEAPAGEQAYVKLGGEIVIDMAHERVMEEVGVTVLTDGRFVMIWSDMDFSSADGDFVKAQIFAADGAPLGSELVISGPARVAADPEITALSGGGFVATWADNGTGDRAQVFDGNGNPVGAQFGIPGGTVELAALPDGGFALVTTGSGDVRLRTYDAAGTPTSSDVLVNTSTAGTQNAPSIAVLATGGMVVSWFDDKGNGLGADDRIMAQIFDASGAKVGTELTISGGQRPLASAWASPVTALPNGNFAISWLEAHPEYDRVTQTQIFTAAGAPVGAPIETPYRMWATGTGAPDVAALADGSLAIVWMANNYPSSDGSDRGVFVQVYGADGAPLSPEMLVNTQTFGEQIVPSIAALDDGGFVVTWTDVNGTGWEDDQVKAQVFTPSDAGEMVVITSNGGGSAAALAIGENTSSPTTVVATGGSAPLTYAIAGGADAARFSIGFDGALTFRGGAPNFEAPSDANGDNIYEVVVSASDGLRIDTQVLTITVGNLNDNAPVIAGLGASAILGHSENGLLVRDIDAPDADGAPVTFSLSGPDAAKFTLDPVTGELRFVTAPDYEAPGSAAGTNDYSVTITASDGVNSDTVALTVRINNVAEPLAITSLGGGDTAAVTVDENTTAVTTVVAVDPDLNAPTFLILGGADATRFTINADTGELTFRAAPNFEAPGDADGDNVYTVIVRASDGTSTDSQTIAVTVGNVNEVPVISSNGGSDTAAVTVNENTTVVTTVVAADPDLTAPAYAIVGGADAACFTVDATTGVLAFVTAPDFETRGDADGDNVYTVTIGAGDGISSDSQTISVTVGNVNEPLAITSLGGGETAALTVDENATAVATVVAADPELGAPSYAIVGGADAARFAINTVTGVLRFVAAPNFEAPGDADGDNVYNVIVRASDGTSTDSQAIAVTVGNVNEAPVITSNGGGATASISLSENSGAVTTVAANDPEGGVTYAIAGGADAARFAIDAATGALSFVSAADFETPADADGNNVYDVVVSASDGTSSDSQALAVTVTDAFEGVLAFAETDFELYENYPDGMLLKLTDPGAAGAAFAITGGADAASFTVDAATGYLTFAGGDYEAPADADGDNVYEVAVTATLAGDTVTDTIRFTVRGYNEAPTFVTGAAWSVAEGEYVVGYLLGADPEGDPVRYYLAGGADAALFGVDRETGMLGFIGEAPDYEAPGDADGDNVYEIEVAVGDGENAELQTLSVAVTDVEAEYSPFVVSSFEVNENTYYPFVYLELTDPFPTLSQFWIDGGADADDFIVDTTTGRLTFRGGADYEWPTDADGDNVFEVVVGGLAAFGSVTQIIRFTVNDVDEKPMFTSFPSSTLAENQTLAAVVEAFDPDGNAVSYQLSGGVDAGRFAIDAQSGELRFLIAPDYEAPADADGDSLYEVEVMATDGTTSAFQTITIEVENVVDGLEFVDTRFAVLETSSYAVDLQVTGPDLATYEITGGADAARFAYVVYPGHTVLGFASRPDFENPTDANGDNIYEVELRATANGASVTQTLRFTVHDVDEAPVITSNGGEDWAAISVNEGGSLSVTTITSTDPENAPRTYSIVGGADAARFTINTLLGTLSFAGSVNFEAPTDADGNNVYKVVVAASDGTASDFQEISVTVLNVNEKPAISSSGSFSLQENTTSVGIVLASDPDGQPLTYSIGGVDSAFFSIDAATGALSFVNAPNYEVRADSGANNIYNLNVLVSDGALSTSRALSVTVTNVNEAPVITTGGGGATAAYTVNENVTGIATIASTDPEGSSRTYSIAGGADASRFSISASTGQLSFTSARNFEAPSDVGGNNVYEVIVRASDGTLSDTQAISVTVANVNEAPVITSNGGASTAAISVAENTTAVTTVIASDPESAPRTYSISGGADAAQFTIDATTGALSFTAAPNFETPVDADTNNVYQVVVRASDGSLSDTQTLTVTVGNVNESPSITSPSAVSMTENGTAAVTVTAADLDGDVVTFAIAGGADAALFAIDSVTGALSLTSAPDFEAPGDADGDNAYEVVVIASDGTLTDTQALSVGVTNANEAPAIVSGGGGTSFALELDEGVSAVTTVVATDVDADTALTYSIASAFDGALFAIDPASGALHFVAAPDFEAPAGGDNFYTVIVTASDGELATWQSIQVLVRNVNEGLAITSPAAASVLENATAVATVTASDVDGEAVGYSIAGGADAARFTIDAATGALSFVAAPNFEAPGDANGNNLYEVTVAASDGSLVATQALTVTVGNVIETPAITSGGGGASAAHTISENATAVATITATDPEGPATFTLAGGVDAARFAIDPATGALRFLAAPDYDAPGDANGDNVYEVSVGVSYGNLGGTQALTVTVGNLVDGLTFNGTTKADTLAGSHQEDTINGLAGNDTLTGLGGADTIDGGDGQDKLTGGAGADLLTGGAKGDTFLYGALSDSTVAASDRIVDFDPSQDRIDLSAIDASTALGGNQAFSFIGSAAFSNAAGQLRAFQQGSDTLVQGDVNGDGLADFQLIVGPLATLVAGDFVL